MNHSLYLTGNDVLYAGGRNIQLHHSSRTYMMRKIDLALKDLKPGPAGSAGEQFSSRGVLEKYERKKEMFLQAGEKWRKIRGINSEGKMYLTQEG